MGGRAGQGVEGKPRWQGELKVGRRTRGPAKTPGSGTTVPQHVPGHWEPPAVGLGAWAGGGRVWGGDGVAATGMLSPLTQSCCLLATWGFGLCFGSQAFGLSELEVFELPASLVAGISAVAG